MKSDLVIEIKTQNDLTSWEVGERLLSEVFSAPKLIPQRVASFAEVSSRNGSDVGALADCRAHWGLKATLKVEGAKSEFTQDFHWVRKRVAKSQGAITFAGETKPRGGRSPVASNFGRSIGPKSTGRGCFVNGACRRNPMRQFYIRLCCWMVRMQAHRAASMRCNKMRGPAIWEEASSPSFAREI